MITCSSTVQNRNEIFIDVVRNRTKFLSSLHLWAVDYCEATDISWGHPGHCVLYSCNKEFCIRPKHIVVLVRCLFFDNNDVSFPRPPRIREAFTCQRIFLPVQQVWMMKGTQTFQMDQSDSTQFNHLKSADMSRNQVRHQTLLTFRELATFNWYIRYFRGPSNPKTRKSIHSTTFLGSRPNIWPSLLCITYVATGWPLPSSFLEMPCSCDNLATIA